MPQAHASVTTASPVCASICVVVFFWFELALPENRDVCWYERCLRQRLRRAVGKATGQSRTVQVMIGQVRADLMPAALKAAIQGALVVPL